MATARVSLDYGAVDTWLQRLEGTLGDQIAAATNLVTEAVAQDARDNHSFQNRTGDLEAMTQSGGVAGSFLSDTLIGDVTADMPYASFVEDKGFEFLLPAFDRSDASGVIDRILADAIEQAVNLTR